MALSGETTPSGKLIYRLLNRTNYIAIEGPFTSQAGNKKNYLLPFLPLVVKARD